MIYEFPKEDKPIRQGDIFLGIPKVQIELATGLAVIEPSNDIINTPWDAIWDKKEPTPTVLSVLPVPAIVVSQNCDTRWGESITLCEIKEFDQVEKNAATAIKLSSMISIITQHARWKLKWFYLPPDNKLGFDKRMAVDFLNTIRVLRDDLVMFIKLRKGCLKPVANDHFRERLAHFYRRYAYDEWYPLSKEEMDIYSKNDPTVSRYDWQK
ncbi:MAG: hypothetical protein LLF92_05405 [Planctomycetaceae bacterium]|nr:hypothetical protein [Planctomycetaceae bacterium]